MQPVALSSGVPYNVTSKGKVFPTTKYTVYVYNNATTFIQNTTYFPSVEASNVAGTTHKRGTGTLVRPLP